MAFSLLINSRKVSGTEIVDATRNLAPASLTSRMMQSTVEELLLVMIWPALSTRLRRRVRRSCVPVVGCRIGFMCAATEAHYDMDDHFAEALLQRVAALWLMIVSA